MEQVIYAALTGKKRKVPAGISYEKGKERQLYLSAPFEGDITPAHYETLATELKLAPFRDFYGVGVRLSLPGVIGDDLFEMVFVPGTIVRAGRKMMAITIRITPEHLYAEMEPVQKDPLCGFAIARMDPRHLKTFCVWLERDLSWSYNALRNYGNLKVAALAASGRIKEAAGPKPKKEDLDPAVDLLCAVGDFRFALLLGMPWLNGLYLKFRKRGQIVKAV